MINLAYDDRGSGDPVLFIAGRGGAGRTWHLHQVPAFQRAGYRVITFDNRGIGATENAGGLTTETMVGDTAALIEQLVGGPVRVVGVSMGSFIAQELMLVRPDLVSQAVLMATRGPRSTAPGVLPPRRTRADRRRHQLPPEYDAKIRVLENFSPKTLNDDRPSPTGWRCSPCGPPRPPGPARPAGGGPRRQPAARLPVHPAPVLVIGFADDVLLPPHLGREVADALPNGRYLEIPDAGHLGFIERPDAVNGAMLEFFAGQPRRMTGCVR